MPLLTTPFTMRSTASDVLAGVDLTGKRMIVTRGASGLGTETVRALAQAGAEVVIATRNPAEAKPILEEFPKTQAAALDLADLRSVRAFTDAWNGPVDELVANADVTADALLAVGISRRWADDGIVANSCEPGWIHTNLQRHLSPDVMRAYGAMDEDGNLLTPDYYKTPAQGASTTVLLAASPLLEGVTGRYFEDNRESEPMDGGPEFTMTGVAHWSIDPKNADRLWDYSLPYLSAA